MAVVSFSAIHVYAEYQYIKIFKEVVFSKEFMKKCFVGTFDDLIYMEYTLPAMCFLFNLYRMRIWQPDDNRILKNEQYFIYIAIYY